MEQFLREREDMKISIRVAVFSLVGESSNFWSSWCLSVDVKVEDKKWNDHKHLELIIFSNKQGLGWSENKRENKLEKEQKWIGKYTLESLGDSAFNLSIGLMPYLYCVWGRR